jgi:hypothetical protein
MPAGASKPKACLQLGGDGKPTPGQQGFLSQRGIQAMEAERDWPKNPHLEGMQCYNDEPRSEDDDAIVAEQQGDLVPQGSPCVRLPLCSLREEWLPGECRDMPGTHGMWENAARYAHPTILL